jgi:hypothetical protein
VEDEKLRDLNVGIIIRFLSIAILMSCQ